MQTIDRFVPLLVILAVFALVGTLLHWYPKAYLKKVWEDLNRAMHTGIILRPYALILKSGTAVQILLPRVPNRNYPYSDRMLEQAKFPGLFERLQNSLGALVCKAVNDPTPQLDRIAAFDYGAANWDKMILADFDHAKIVVICPLYLSKGLLWELNSLLERNQFWKVFFVVPTTGDAGDMYSIADGWRNCVIELRNLKVVLPHRLPQPGILCESRHLTYDVVIPWNRVNEKILTAIAASRNMGKFHSILADLGAPMLPLRSPEQRHRSDA